MKKICRLSLRIPVDFWIFPAGPPAVMILVLDHDHFHSLKAAGTDPAPPLKASELSINDKAGRFQDLDVIENYLQVCFPRFCVSSIF